MGGGEVADPDAAGMGPEVGQGLAVLVGDHRVAAAHAVVGGVLDVADPRHGAGDEVRRRPGVDDRVLLLGLGEAVQEDEGRVFLLAEDPERAEAGGFGAEQERGGVDQVAVDDGDVDRQVVADQPPAPGGVGLWLAEEGQEVAAGVAEGGGDVTEHGQVELAEHVLVGHHLHHSGVGRDRHRLGDQPVGQHLLVAVELSEREAVPAGLGQEVPVRPAGIRVGQQHPRPLIAGQAVEQPHRGEGQHRRVERPALPRLVRLRELTARDADAASSS